jgi:hypothetical protein
VGGASILKDYQTWFAQVICTKGFGVLLSKMQEQRRAIQ